MAAGLDPDAFWRQTPRTFVAIMEGRNHAAKRQHDMAIAQAWHTEAFAREKRLKPLAKYLTASQPRVAQGSAEILATLREIQARGAVMNFRKVEG